MASTTNFISFLFLATLFFSLQINARESQFFSKVTPLNNDNNDKKAELPNKQAFVTVSKNEQEPTFIPESQNGYGLYGHESGQLPPSATTPTKNGAFYTAANTYLPHKPESEEETYKYTSNTNDNNNNYYYYNKDAYEANRNSYFNSKDSYDASRNGMNNAQLTGSGYSSNNKNYYFKKDVYGANLNDLSNTKLTDTSYNTMSNQNNNRNDYNNAAKKFKMERQGMSDTRYLEGGKFYYDLESEKYNPTMYGNSREVETRFSHNNGYYANNQNLYENNNSVYQNQEFEDDQDEFQP